MWRWHTLLMRSHTWTNRIMGGELLKSNFEGPHPGLINRHLGPFCFYRDSLRSHKWGTNNGEFFCWLVWRFLKTWMSTVWSVIPFVWGLGPTTVVVHWGGARSNRAWPWRSVGDIPRPTPWRSSCESCTCVWADRPPQSLEWLTERAGQRIPGC